MARFGVNCLLHLKPTNLSNVLLICSKFNYRYNLGTKYLLAKKSYKISINEIEVCIDFDKISLVYTSRCITVKLDKDYYWNSKTFIFSVFDDISEVLLLHMYLADTWSVIGHNIELTYKLVNPKDLWLSIQEISNWALHQPELVRIIEMANE